MYAVTTKNPVFLIILGAICVALEYYLPSGVEIFDHVEFITIYSLAKTSMFGAGIGLLIVGTMRLVKSFV